MALMLGHLTAGLEGLDTGTIRITEHHFIRVMPKDDTATTRATEWQQLMGWALTGVDIDEEFHLLLPP